MTLMKIETKKGNVNIEVLEDKMHRETKVVLSWKIENKGFGTAVTIGKRVLKHKPIPLKERIKRSIKALKTKEEHFYEVER
jgi:hypothetical protein